MKILILKPSSLGDIVQALPVLRLLKLHLPASQIYWWIESRWAPVLEHDPDLAGIIRFERDRWAAPRHWGELWRSVRQLRALHFDWVLDLQSLARSGAFAWLANGKLTVGLDEPREGARGFYDVVARRRSFHTHAVDWYLEVLRLLQVPVHWNFKWLPEQPRVQSVLRQKWPLDGARWLLLLPGARWLNKRWPLEHFAHLVRHLARNEKNVRLAVLGGAQDAPLGRALTLAAPGQCLDLTGQLTLPEMIEWIRSAELVLTNDTGPMHVAAALAKPTVALFGPTEPRRTGPYGQTSNVLQLGLPCVPCLKSYCVNPRPLECLQRLSPTTVLDLVTEKLRPGS